VIGSQKASIHENADFWPSGPEVLKEQIQILHFSGHDGRKTRGSGKVSPIAGTHVLRRNQNPIIKPVIHITLKNESI
jgi:hypothetical protein